MKFQWSTRCKLDMPVWRCIQKKTRLPQKHTGMGFGVFLTIRTNHSIPPPPLLGPSFNALELPKIYQILVYHHSNQNIISFKKKLHLLKLATFLNWIQTTHEKGCKCTNEQYSWNESNWTKLKKSLNLATLLTWSIFQYTGDPKNQAIRCLQSFNLNIKR